MISKILFLTLFFFLLYPYLVYLEKKGYMSHFWLCYVLVAASASLCLFLVPSFSKAMSLVIFGILSFTAALSDQKTHEVEPYLSFMIFCLSLPLQNEKHFLFSLLSVLLLVIPEILSLFLKDSKPLGGADILYASAVCFYLTPPLGILAFLSGLLLFFIYYLILFLFKKAHKEKAYPLFPFLTLASFSLALLQNLH